MAGRKGFTLMELIFVLIIVGTLASLAMSRYSATFEKMRAAEGFQILETLRNAQHAYKMETGSYAAAIGNLDVDVPAPANFFPPGVNNDANRLADLSRRTGTYGLIIDEPGVITCDDGGSGMCAKIGCGGGTCN